LEIVVEASHRRWIGLSVVCKDLGCSFLGHLQGGRVEDISQPTLDLDLGVSRQLVQGVAHLASQATLSQTVAPQYRSEHVLFVIRRQEFHMQRHPYEWPILAENRWPSHGRELTPAIRADPCSACSSDERPVPLRLMVYAVREIEAAAV